MTSLKQKAARNKWNKENVIQTNIKWYPSDSETLAKVRKAAEYYSSTSMFIKDAVKNYVEYFSDRCEDAEYWERECREMDGKYQDLECEHYELEEKCSDLEYVNECLLEEIDTMEEPVYMLERLGLYDRYDLREDARRLLKSHEEGWITLTDEQVKDLQIKCSGPEPDEGLYDLLSTVMETAHTPMEYLEYVGKLEKVVEQVEELLERLRRLSTVTRIKDMKTLIESLEPLVERIAYDIE